MTDTNELRKLLNAATPTPWAVSYGDKSWEVVQTKPDGTPDLFARRTAFDDGSACGEYCPSCNGPTRDLIVAAVNALPALLDELDAAREHMGVVQSALDAAHLEQVEDELGGLRAEIRRLDSVIDDIEERAWKALGEPEGTYDSTNVQRLCAEVERLRDMLARLCIAVEHSAPGYGVYEDWGDICDGDLLALRERMIEAKALLAKHKEKQ